jgi:hypothetical protein
MNFTLMISILKDLKKSIVFSDFGVISALQSGHFGD